jgi:hypothetical protein
MYATEQGKEVDDRFEHRATLTSDRSLSRPLEPSWHAVQTMRRMR